MPSGVVRGNGFRRDMYGVEATRMVGFGVKFMLMLSLPFVAGLLPARGWRSIQAEAER